MTVIYIDVLFAVNFIINILLIEASGVILRLSSVWYRTLFASALGALYAVCVFFPNLHLLYTFLMKIAFSALIVAVAYKTKNFRSFLRLWATFYAVSFVFGGCVAAVLSLTELGRKTGAIYSNGIIYLNLPWQTLFVSTLIAYILVLILGRVRKKRIACDAAKRIVEIRLGKKSVSLNAIIDTGNSLFDPITGDPVMVAEYDAVKPLLPEGEGSLLESMSRAGLKVRLIPFSSVGVDGGIMPAFLPDAVTIENRAVKRCVVCICSRSLSQMGEYRALLNPQLAVS
ncbi:MAG: sigma-E processing peptidase SpoIIGA [Clostridia bacterium]|nr:sigma-E processing peptidase SpoIIGA [Clostridia bacterium]